MKLQDVVVLKLFVEPFEVIKRTPPVPFPSWLTSAEVFFIAQTQDEYSIMCPKAAVPSSWQSDTDWRCFRVDGEIAPDQSGVAASVSAPIAKAGLSLILVGTHDRDYVLVESRLLDQVVQTYQQAGFSVE